MQREFRRLRSLHDPLRQVRREEGEADHPRGVAFVRLVGPRHFAHRGEAPVEEIAPPPVRLSAASGSGSRPP